MFVHEGNNVLYTTHDVNANLAQSDDNRFQVGSYPTIDLLALSWWVRGQNSDTEHALHFSDGVWTLYRGTVTKDKDSNLSRLIQRNTEALETMPNMTAPITKTVSVDSVTEFFSTDSNAFGYVSGIPYQVMVAPNSTRFHNEGNNWVAVQCLLYLLSVLPRIGVGSKVFVSYTSIRSDYRVKEVYIHQPTTGKVTVCVILEDDKASE